MAACSTGREGPCRKAEVSFYASSLAVFCTHTPVRPSKFPSLERRLEEWVKIASKAGKTLTDSVLRQKARELGDEMGYTADKFKASSGWLENFEHHHGIRRGQYNGSATRVFLGQCMAAGVHKVPTEKCRS